MTYEIVLQCKNQTFFDKRFTAQNITTFDDLEKKAKAYFASISIKNNLFENIVCTKKIKIY